MLGFAEDDSDVACLDTMTGMVHVESADIVARHMLAWERLTRIALTPEDSLELLGEMAKET